MRSSLGFVAGVTLLMATAVCAGAADYYVIPFDVDPPIVVDGDLSDWGNVPNALTITDRAQVTDGAQYWSGPADLSGTVHLAWRQEGIFVAAEVRDDVISQTMTGKDMWRGDHVCVLLDMIPGIEPQRSGFGAGQVQFGISPGSLGTPVGNAPISPEIFIWVPDNAVQGKGQVAARRTDSGYVVEAFVPWSSVGVSGVAKDKDANFEVALSDNDSAEPAQETWMTVGTSTWTRTRGRLLPVVFGDGNGQAAPPVRSIEIARNVKVPLQKSLTLTFNAPSIPEGKDPFVFFVARFHRPKVAGFAARSMALEVNGKRVPGDRISNRPQSSVWMSGKESVFIAPDGSMAIPYAPSSEEFDKDPYYALIDGYKGCEFEFDLAGMLKEGENVLTFINLVQPGLQGEYDITLDRVEFRVKAKAPMAAEPKPAPTGELPVCEPQTSFPKTYSGLAHDSASVSFTVNGESFVVTSNFTAPDGKRYTGSSPYYSHERKVIEHDEWIEVHDTFKNLTGEHVPIIHTHTCSLGDRGKDFWISGIRLPAKVGRQSVPEQPSVFAVTEKSGVGMMPLDDIFRVHGDQVSEGGAISITDPHFVLKAGGEYTAEWAIVPVTRPDLWAFVNAARRALDVNFTMYILSAFLDYRDPVPQWTDEQYRNFIERKSANVVSDGLFCAKWQGRLPQGVAFHELVKDPKNVAYYINGHDRIKKLYPDGSVKYAIYYHCYIDVMDESVERFKDARRLDAAGNQMSYSLDYYRLYVPTLENEFGKEIGKGIDIRLDLLGADAFYWDEYNGSRGTYTYIPDMWDGCSGDIDPKTFELVRLKSAVHLLSLPFLEYHIKRILARVPAFFNGAPWSRTLARLKFQCFTETGSISNCHRMLLYTPVALGDHLTERSQSDAYRVMLRALDWGCLYAWYSRTVYPTHKTLTEHMFPSTPIELHEGYIIAKERIVTNRSGLFGWADNSDFDIYVYDREGRITKGDEARKVQRGGKTYAEIRIPEGYSAAVVRKVAAQ